MPETEARARSVKAAADPRTRTATPAALKNEPEPRAEWGVRARSPRPAEELPAPPVSRTEGRGRVRARSVKQEEPEPRPQWGVRTRSPRPAEEPAPLPGARMEARAGIRARSVKREEPEPRPERSVRARSPRPTAKSELGAALMRGGGSPERRRELAEARLALTAPPPALPDSARPALPDSA